MLISAKFRAISKRVGVLLGFLGYLFLLQRCGQFPGDDDNDNDDSDDPVVTVPTVAPSGWDGKSDHDGDWQVTTE